MADEDFGKRQPYAFLEEVRLNGEGLQEITEKNRCWFHGESALYVFFFSNFWIKFIINIFSKVVAISLSVQ